MTNDTTTTYMTKRIQNIRTTILRSLMVVAMIVYGVGEGWAGVAYDEVKDGKMYMIANYIAAGPYTNYVSYANSTLTYGTKPTTESNGYWTAHSTGTTNQYYFESYSTSGYYFNGSLGTSTSKSSTNGSYFTLSAGVKDGCVTMRTYLNNNNRNMGGGDGTTYIFGTYGGKGCYSTNGTTNDQSTWSTDWLLMPVYTVTLADPSGQGSISYDGKTYNSSSNYICFPNDAVESDDITCATVPGYFPSVVVDNDNYTITVTYLKAYAYRLIGAKDANNGNALVTENFWLDILNGSNQANETKNASINHIAQLVILESSGSKYKMQNAAGNYLQVNSSRTWSAIIGGTSDNAIEWTIAEPSTGIFTFYQTAGSTGYLYKDNMFTDGNALYLGGNETNKLTWKRYDWSDVHTVTANTVTGGTISASTETPGQLMTGFGSYAVGDVITLTATPDAGYALDSWNVTDADGGTVTVTSNQFTMPNKNVTVSAKFVVTTSPTSITPDPASISMGTTGTKKITYTLADQPCYDKVVFTSSNTSVATVDSNTGVVTAVSAGTATITLSAYAYNSTVVACSTTVPVTIMEQCAKPVITNTSGRTYTITTATSGATIYYTTDGSEPTNSSNVYSGSVTLSSTQFIIKAIAIKDGMLNSEISIVSLGGDGSSADNPYYIASSTELAYVVDHPTLFYKVVADFSASDNTPISNFSGTFDGGFYTISGLNNALFGSVTGGTVQNVILDNVSISGSGNRGAIANEASGNARIYNCGVLATNSTFEFDKTYSSSSTVTSTDAAAGSIVGVISDNARVLNCYSYADVSGSTYGAGIVGRSTGTWINTTTVQSTQNFVMNCMFYGNVSGNTRSPIVNATTNDNYSMYSYFRYKSLSSTTNLTQNGALAIQEDIWLKRFAFFQAAVTNHRDLAALYCFNDATRISEIAQWYINEDVAPWPILRKAEAQKTTLNRTIPNTGNANEGNLVTNGKKLLDADDKTKVIEDDVTKRYNMSVGSSGYLTVNYTISDGTVSTSNSVQLPITDMDYDHYDYTWGKVVLPFINEFDAWRDATNKDYSKVCIGWEITGMTGGTTGTLTDYNYADRNCTAKDIYNATTNPLLYAQGGNFIVPYGVTAININAHFATAYYLSDASYDCYASGGNTRGTRPTTYHGQTVYTSAATAWAAMSTTTSPNDQALVLVGNYHYTSNTSGTYTAYGCTVMSVDDDNDQQPDYGWYSSVGDYRQYWPSMRWTFVPIIGAGMAQKYSSMPPGLAIPVATGWWEMTETTLCRTFEFEISDNHRTNTDNGYGNNCYIINGGWFQQLVRSWDGTCDRLSYVKVGGNAYIKEFFHGNHSSQSRQWTVRPINVTGGEIPSCFMTGMGNKNVISTTNNNIRFYCAGGKIDKYLSVYMEYTVVDATMKVDHAYINRFFGGGTTGKAQLTGNIDITMDHSDVTFFCGGPEFGDMTSGKTVTVNTTGSIFGEYYGAGFGGTALTRNLNTEGSSGMSAINNYSSCYLQYSASKGGVGVSYEMEALLNGSGTALYRFYDYYAALSLATTGSVTTTATNCLFKNNFYGGGCQGKVNGIITSTLTDCDVTGSAFGGGYKAASTTIAVYPTTTPTYPIFDTTYKAFSDMDYPASTEYTWISGTSTGTVSGTTIQSGLTEDESKTLGQVTDNISITVQSSSDGAATVGGSVFGGGNESSSLKNTDVKILGNTHVGVNVYGGGNQATVGGTTHVQIGDACE